jgi:RNA polymerase sigma-70 factor (ECF subfamily)
VKRALSSAEASSGPPGPFDLEDVYRAHAGDVARWAARLAGPGFDREDIVHEVFLVAQRRFPTFRRAGNIKVWHWGGPHPTTAFIVRKRRRSERWRRLLTGTQDAVERVPSAGPTPLEELERCRRDRRLYETLDLLPEKYRTVLILFDLDGLSGEEVVALTGRKVATLRVWLFRAREMFLERFRAGLEQDVPGGRKGDIDG